MASSSDSSASIDLASAASAAHAGSSTAGAGSSAHVVMTAREAEKVQAALDNELLGAQAKLNERKEAFAAAAAAAEMRRRQASRHLNDEL